MTFAINRAQPPSHLCMLWEISEAPQGFQLELWSPLRHLYSMKHKHVWIEGPTRKGDFQFLYSINFGVMLKRNTEQLSPGFKKSLNLQERWHVHTSQFANRGIHPREASSFDNWSRFVNISPRNSFAAASWHFRESGIEYQSNLQINSFTWTMLVVTYSLTLTLTLCPNTQNFFPYYIDCTYIYIYIYIYHLML